MGVLQIMLMMMLLAAVIVQASSKNAPGNLYSLSTLSLVFIDYVDYDNAHADVLNDAHGDAYGVVVASSHGPSIF